MLCTLEFCLFQPKYVFISCTPITGIIMQYFIDSVVPDRLHCMCNSKIRSKIHASHSRATKHTKYNFKKYSKTCEQITMKRL